MRIDLPVTRIWLRAVLSSLVKPCNQRLCATARSRRSSVVALLGWSTSGCDSACISVKRWRWVEASRPPLSVTKSATL